jgi:hypothetical protein
LLAVEEAEQKQVAAVVLAVIAVPLWVSCQVAIHQPNQFCL